MSLQEVSLQTIWNWNLEARKNLKKKTSNKQKKAKKKHFWAAKGALLPRP